jgi:ProP effector
MTKDKLDVWPIIALLAANFPKTFVIFEQRRRPLKIGVHRDILDRLGDAIEPGQLSIAMRVYTANEYYLRACTIGAARIYLDGSAAGEVTAEEAEGCRLRLEARRAKRKPTQAQAPTTEPTQAPITESTPAPALAPQRLSLADLKVAG